MPAMPRRTRRPARCLDSSGNCASGSVSLRPATGDDETTEARHGGRPMRIGVIVPQGWTGEYDGWEPLEAWRRTTEVARQAERLGFESIWLFDHFHTVPEPTDEITFESFTSLAALAAMTERVRLGHIVICTAFRNP